MAEGFPCHFVYNRRADYHPPDHDPSFPHNIHRNPKQPENNEMDRPLKLATLSLICLVLALVMPAIRIQALGTTTDLNGWHASLWAFGTGVESLLGIYMHPAGTGWRYIALALSAVMNVTFILAVATLARKNGSQNNIRRMTVFAALGILLAIAAPWLPDIKPTSVLAGYYLWLVAYVVLLSALASAWRREPRDTQRQLY
jgi:uncharacterized paraquat-inducible protein A